jgi:cyclophilin family peptidyl-prolyl cis-trans isomerase
MLSQADKLWHLGVMNVKPISTLILAALAATAAAQTPAPSSSPAPQPAAAPDPAKLAPSEIVAAAPASDWVAIAPEDLLVMTLASGRRVVIQLMPPPFSQGWIGNIRKLAAAHWWDGLSINRVQDNYVVQWGDASEKKALPPGLVAVPESDYVVPRALLRPRPLDPLFVPPNDINRWTSFFGAFPVAGVGTPDSERNWPVHCYAMVGVGRNLSPDTGNGAELYTVIGHAPRHLDRNIAVVGRIISGIEHLSSLPRGTGALGFYEKVEERVAIAQIRLGSELLAAEQAAYEYLSPLSPSFARYAAARANRRDAFFNVPAGGTDICNIPVPIRKKP